LAFLEESLEDSSCERGTLPIAREGENVFFSLTLIVLEERITNQNFVSFKCELIWLNGK